jgi:hypothetical protein
MVPDEFLPSTKLVGMWRAGLEESARISQGQNAASVIADVPSEVLIEEITGTIYDIIIAEFRYMRARYPKVLPLFGEGGLWPCISKHLDHSLHMCDEGAAKFLKQLERELQAFFDAGKTWEANWGKVCVDDGTVNVHLTANVPEHYEPSRKKTLDIEL